MKQIRLLLICISLLLHCFFVLGQNKGALQGLTYDPYPFAQGKNLFPHQRSLKLHHYNECDDGQKIGNSDLFDMHIEYKYFPKKHFGIGLDLALNRSGDHYTFDNLDRQFLVTPNFTYGRPLSNKVNIYGEGGISFGNYKNIYKTGSTANTNKESLFGYHITLGLPARIDKYSTFITPKISYDFLQYKGDNNTTKKSGALISLNLESYLRCSEMAWDCRKKHNLSGLMYNQGRNYVYSSMGDLEFGKTKSEYKVGNITTTQEDKYTNSHVRLVYGRYLFNNAGIGASAGIRNIVQKSKDNDIRSTWSTYSFSPRAFVHLPTDNSWNNLFGQFEYKFGYEKTEYKVNNNTTTSKNNISGWGASLGYNLFFADRTAATFSAGYVDRTTKQKDVANPVIRQEGGINLQVNLKYSW